MIFTTIDECQEKINRMRELVIELNTCANIQFPIVDSYEEQFQHYSVNDLQDIIKCLNKPLDDLQHELDRYKKIKESLHGDN